MRITFVEGKTGLCVTHNTPVPRIGEMVLFEKKPYRVHDVQWIVIDHNRINATVIIGRISP